MKKIIVLSSFFLATFAMAQTPAMIDHQVSFAQIENAPTYPGCADNDKDCFTQSISKAVSANMNTAAFSNITEKQKVVVMFTVDTEGNIVDIVTKSKNKALEAEARKVVSELPQMTAGTLSDGKKVAVTYTLPIVFESKIQKSLQNIVEPTRIQKN